MSFNAIFEEVYAILQADASLIPGILGPKTVTNQRIYRAWAQQEVFLRGYEPNQPAEGYIVIEEPQPSLGTRREQYTSNHEFVDVLFHIYGTTFALGHDVLDVLDSYWQWTVEQQREVRWGERWLLFTRRTQDIDKYQADIKLAEKQVSYAMEFVRDEDWL